MARSGGFMHNPTAAQILATSCGAAEIFNVSNLCGRIP